MSDHSLCSYNEKYQFLPLTCTGTCKVKYRPEDDWDFYLDMSHMQKPIDMSLILPHYRARHQPVNHLMSMFVASETSHMRLKICRPALSSRFYVELRAVSSDITVWLPSDFKGKIYYTGKAKFSAGFVNKIMGNVSFNDDLLCNPCTEDVAVVSTSGHVTFRMWDVRTCSPEVAHKEAMRRMFACVRKAPETAINWDFLLED
ncbi:hypothetical protein M378DRAFT_8607 [Amanita muscaria Koide BX008]|uniref:Uncharacterized protein n=1 Tax=Amanita muscaria (strain Koide BX008) TaxID=946122 RepID=A0A0C2XGK6_AMAMK|nr:hypothetical protein M378DRAFT_8607 [Amanita muscaria Koide BX008]